ncbi:hypothetical protein GCM10009123_10970 [Kangiella japonica]|uniref:Uncharacterized protein n=1 Tax=Kangiella japonica TaxID=647384 RepID=A0ABN0SXI3_9GAMM
MDVLRKKSSLLSSAFFVLCLSIFSLKAEAKIRCKSKDFTDDITRSQITGSGSSSTAYGFNNLQRKAISAQKVNLNIQLDISSLAKVQVTAESNDWIWELKAGGKDGLRGDIIAKYKIESASGPMKICSSSSSCIEVVRLDTDVTYKRNGKGVITRANGRIQLTLDLSQANEAGSYQGDMTVTLHEDSTTNPALCP